MKRIEYSVCGETRKSELEEQEEGVQRKRERMRSRRKVCRDSERG